MPPRQSERTLRRLIADLAERPRADVRAVLADLAPEQRARAEKLLADFRGTATPPTRAEPAASIDTEGLSPWLAARLRTATGDPAAVDFAMTPMAMESLRQAAAQTGNPRRPPASKPSGGVGLALFDRMARWLGRVAP